jgi:hypothetical protein
LSQKHELIGGIKYVMNLSVFALLTADVIRNKVCWIIAHRWSLSELAFTDTSAMIDGNDHADRMNIFDVETVNRNQVRY